ncbi:MAG: FkbM family methyltransferase [Candidatus Buchananbacteria bacterium]|nr:FkbM family methyltransferase [Candidatus Buchananbacteria bacterium]
MKEIKYKFFMSKAILFFKTDRLIGLLGIIIKKLSPSLYSTIKIIDKDRTRIFDLKNKNLRAKIKCIYNKNNRLIFTRHIIDEIWNTNTYNPPGFELKNNDTVIDIGANIGIFSVYAAKQAPAGIIYAYEPEPDNFKLLEENIVINRLTNIKPFKLGVGRNEKVKLLKSNFSSASHSLYGQIGGAVDIDCVSLTNIFDINQIDCCHFLKLDCEGSEYEILFNLPDEYFRRIKLISLEYHDFFSDNRNGGNLKIFLESKGFIVTIKPTIAKLGQIYAKNKTLI